MENIHILPLTAVTSSSIYINQYNLYEKSHSQEQKINTQKT